MILDDFRKALGQIGDPRFRRVLLLGLGLTLALLVGAAAATGWLVGWIFPDTLTLPWIGEVTFLQTIASGLSVVAVLGLSVFLMVPVASAFTGIFLDDVADAVEQVHYPQLPPATDVPFLSGVADSLRFLGLVVAANIAAFALYLLMPPLAPVIFWALNGFLLGREYFQLVAVRRMQESAAKQLRRRHAGQIWLAGCLMAVPLTIPVINLVVPILGAATFTHLFHRLAGNAAR